MGAMGVHGVSASTIAQWSFTAAQASPVNSPAPTSGNGTTVSRGMANSYTYAGGETTPTTSNDDITQPGGTGQLTDFTWRIRGFSNKSGQPGNGWNNSAPNYTQGAEFEVPLTGYSPTSLTFDWYSTTQGVANMQVQYTLDDTQGSNTVWTNLGSDLLATPNNFYGAPAAGSTTPTNSFDLSSIAGAAGDANFAVEMVSVRPVVGDADYSATGPGGDGNYAAAAPVSGAYVDYNNSSGNWSFGNITISGTAVPEPASASLLSLAGLALLGRRRAKVSSR